MRRLLLKAKKVAGHAKKKVTVQAAVTTIIVAIISAAFANADRLFNIYKEIGAAPTPYTGEWYGSLREWNSSQQVESVRHETITFTSRRPKEIRGTAVISEGVGRTRQFKGEYGDQVCIISFVAHTGGRSGGASYVLQGDPEADALKGYWLGTDPELGGKLVMGPYVLTKNRNQAEVDAKYQKWLSQKIFVASER